ncbi:hypothetical protein B0H16DRAFT_553107 [Mycena metata]|uniref:Uncharacterized protein n=1 Tax=Mycena metata TaxID=1033252 RepID=A0AAD7ME26_9AGAR|nr:hypothetical protein B0H16DRAFT_553107 [Mycena metata]
MNQHHILPPPRLPRRLWYPNLDVRVDADNLEGYREAPASLSSGLVGWSKRRVVCPATPSPLLPTFSVPRPPPSGAVRVSHRRHDASPARTAQVRRELRSLTQSHLQHAAADFCLFFSSRKRAADSDAAEAGNAHTEDAGIIRRVRPRTMHCGALYMRTWAGRGNIMGRGFEDRARMQIPHPLRPRVRLPRSLVHRRIRMRTHTCAVAVGLSARSCLRTRRECIDRRMGMPSASCSRIRKGRTLVPVQAAPRHRIASARARASGSRRSFPSPISPSARSLRPTN